MYIAPPTVGDTVRTEAVSIGTSVMGSLVMCFLVSACNLDFLDFTPVRIDGMTISRGVSLCEGVTVSRISWPRRAGYMITKTALFRTASTNIVILEMKAHKPSEQEGKTCY